VSTDQVLAGVGLILVLAVGSQILASRLHIPALIILLPAGFLAGAVIIDVNSQQLLGPSFQLLVSLSVAVILYDAGLDLDLRKLRGHPRRIVTRLIVVGVPITWVIAATCAAFLVGLSSRAALLTGAILVVSGPTVVGPLLNAIHPAERLQRVLSWEGSLIDPIGGILGAVVFGAVTTSTHRAPAYQLAQFLLGIGIGIAGGVAGTAASARRALEPALADRDHGPERLRLQAWLIDARIRYDGGDRARGRRSLAAALRLAEREQLRLPFVMELGWIGPVLRREPELAASHRRLLGPILGDDRPPARMDVPEQAAILVIEPLTERERDVLRHFAGMLKTTEVASEIFISVNTVKTHLKNINRKLGATHYGEAVRRARQLDLI
jgi:DNA-binding CsgD family transcriptional regulator